MKPALAEKLFWITGWIYDFTKIVTIVLLTGVLTHYFLITVLSVRGLSMSPNFKDGQILFVNKLSYYLGKPKRGDVVAMFFPGETDKRFIKRIVGLPGELVEIKEGFVYINGQRLTENYLDNRVVTAPNSKRQLLAGEYFVLGDNREVSSDSRAWGPVPESFIIGRTPHQETSAQILN